MYLTMYLIIGGYECSNTIHIEIVASMIKVAKYYMNWLNVRFGPFIIKESFPSESTSK